MLILNEINIIEGALRIETFCSICGQNYIWVRGDTLYCPHCERGTMLEKKIEEYLCRQVKKMNGIAYKFTSPQRRSVPDRLCVFHDLVVFIECKATGGKPTPGQVREIRRLQDKAQWVDVVDSKEAVDLLLEVVQHELNEAKI